MTKDERQELRQIQETLIGPWLGFEMLGTPKPKPKPKRLTLTMTQSPRKGGLLDEYERC
jgi:hypothetical protein